LASNLTARLLGRFRLELDGRPLLDDASFRRKPLALIKLLALAPGHRLSRDQVLAALWPELPAEQGATQLRKNRLLLRQAGSTAGAGDLVHLAGTHLSLDGMGVDIDDFRAAAATAIERRNDPDAFAAALALYDGDLLLDDHSEDWTMEHRSELRATYHRLLIELSRLQQSAGVLASAAETINRLLASDPLHEDAHRSLMRLHLQAGRRDLALAQFDRCREALQRDLAVEPDAETRALLEEIRAASAGRPDSQTDHPFVGRAGEMAQLRRGIEQVRRGQGVVMLISGEAGIGKTCLAESFAAHARDAGARVQWVRSYEDESERGFEKWIHLIGALAGGARASGAATTNPPPEPQPSRIHALLSSSSTAQEALFNQVSEFFVESARRQPLVLIFDDIQWAGLDSLHLLTTVIRETRDAPVMIIATVRSETADTPPAAREPIDELLHDRRSTVLTLRGLSVDEVEGLIAVSARRETVRLAHELWAQTRGNPLFVAEILRALESEQNQSLRRLHVPPRVTGIISRRVARLSSESREVLEYAAVLGGEFTATVLARASSVPYAVLIDLLEEARGNHIVGQSGDSWERLAFEHPLIREVVYNQMPLRRRAELHFGIAQALEQYYGAEAHAHASEIAHHYRLGVAVGGEEEALHYLHQAGLQASAELAFEEAASLFEHQLELALTRRPADRAHHGEIRLRLGTVLYRAYDGSQRGRSEEVLDAALDDARASGSRALFVRVVGALTGKRKSSLGVSAEKITLLREALAIVDDSDLETRCHLSGQLAKELEGEPDDDIRCAAGRAAIALALELGPRETSGQAIVHGLDAIGGPDSLDERLALTAQVVSLALPRGESITTQARLRRYAALLEAGDANGAEREYGQIVEAASRHPVSTTRGWSERWAATISADRLALGGRFDEAEARARDGMSFGQARGDPDALSIFGSQLFHIRWHQGRLPELASLAGNVMNSAPDFWPWRVASALIQLDNGEEQAARAAFERLAVDRFRPIPRDRFWIVTMTIAAELCVRFGDLQRASELLALMSPHADRVAVLGFGYVCSGATARVVGMLYGTLGARDEAQDQFENALRVNAAIGAIPWTAWTSLNYGEMLLRRQPEDTARARSLLSSALEIARERGMAEVQSEAGRLLAT
jgi:DNA-binding SARP family transcriptional activator